jgi:hypothetical protein
MLSQTNQLILLVNKSKYDEDCPGTEMLPSEGTVQNCSQYEPFD